METIYEYSSETRLTFSGLYGLVSQKIKLFIATGVM
jgi:hypothetical protein